MISIPTNRDMLTFSALTSFITKSFEDKLIQSSIHTKILDIKNHIKSNKYDSFIKVDIKNYYPSINHDILFKKLKKQIDDEMALSLLKKAISKYTIANGRINDKSREDNAKGIPQGLSFSNILSAIYFTSIDEKYSKSKKLAYYRFVDDILILCNKKDIEKIKAKITKDTQKLILEIHEFEPNSDKSTSGIINQDSFQFLGYRFFDDKVSVRQSSVDKIRDRIVKVILKNKNNEKELYRKLNLKITGCIYEGKKMGWLNFFALIDDMQLLYSLDNLVKTLFGKFKIKYDEKKIKKFTKAYFELKNKENDYIPKFGDKKNDYNLCDIEDLKNDVEFY